MALGTLFGVLLCMAAFANDWFGVRSMVENDVRSALEDEDFEKELAWDLIARRREDDWPLMRDKDIDVWEAFQTDARPAVKPETDDLDPWEAFNDGGEGRA
jgi:hypothetical protein